MRRHDGGGDAAAALDGDIARLPPTGRGGLAPIVAAEDRAQSTFEYAVVTAALLAVTAALALLWRAGAGGALGALAEEAASHRLDGLGALDIALF